MARVVVAFAFAPKRYDAFGVLALIAFWHPQPLSFTGMRNFSM